MASDQMNSVKNFDIRKLEALRGKALDPEELQEIELFEKGRALQQIAYTQGWEVVKEMLEGYVRGAIEELASLSPAKKEEILAQHAVTFAITELYKRLMQDIDHAIETSKRPPNVVTEQLRKARPGMF